MVKLLDAEAELIGGATLVLAVSAQLKDRIDDAAKNEKVSVDTWVLRAMEKALSANQCEWVVRFAETVRR